MPMDCVINIYYGQLLSSFDAGNFPIRDLNVTIHKVPDDKIYIIGDKLCINYEKFKKIDKDSLLYKFKEFRPNPIQEISKENVMLLSDEKIEENKNNKYYICSYIC